MTGLLCLLYVGNFIKLFRPFSQTLNSPCYLLSLFSLTVPSWVLFSLPSFSLPSLPPLVSSPINQPVWKNRKYEFPSLSFFFSITLPLFSSSLPSSSPYLPNSLHLLTLLSSLPSPFLITFHFSSLHFIPPLLSFPLPPPPFPLPLSLPSVTDKGRNIDVSHT